MNDWSDGSGAVVLLIHPNPVTAEAWLSALAQVQPLWSYRVAVGTHQATRALAAMPFDAIVTSSQLADGDVTTLLNLVERRYPKCTRLVIGEEFGDDQHVSLPASHRFFSELKAAELCQAIEGNHELQRCLSDPAVLAIVHTTDILPSPPAGILTLNNLMMNPEASLSDVADVITDDPAMTAKLLQLVNSAYFGLSHRVTTARQAVSLLGFSTVRNLLMAVELMRAFRVPRGELSSAVEDLQDHSLAVANLARTIMGDGAESNDAFTAGMLHDIGMLAVISALPDRFVALRDEVVHGKRPIEESEQSILGTSHAHIGAYLLDQWGLPTNLVEAVARSHDAAHLSSAHLGPVHAVYVAEQILAMLGSKTIFWEQGDVFEEGYLAALGIDDEVTRILTSSRVS